MKKFNVTVNGKTYEVEVEEVEGVSTTTPAAKPIVEPEVAASAPVGGSPVLAPMPGTIFDIKVNEGDIVQEGQVLLVLEAMKMENEIMAPAAGKVISINKSKGVIVSSGDVLVVLE